MECSAVTLEQLDQHHIFVINPIIYAECSVGFKQIEEVEALILNMYLKKLYFWQVKLFFNTKDEKGGKNNVLPDFFIGSHAAVSGFQLMTRDKGRFSTYFPNVELIMPESSSGLN